MYDSDIYSEPAQLRRPLAWSLGLHVTFAAFVLLYATFIHSFRGEGWGSGGGGDAMGATLVSAVPLPANPAETTNVWQRNPRGWQKSQPMVQEKEPESDSDSRQEREDKNETHAAERDAAQGRTRTPESNQIPYGEGGPVGGPYTMSAGGAKGGFGFTGSGGDFGSRFSCTSKRCSGK